ncbi:MAG: hypothetical protein JNM10_14645 [Planctomycetia bacterium]|nr:hypothetical protein [Planctomycetia bacterium]
MSSPAASGASARGLSSRRLLAAVGALAVSIATAGPCLAGPAGEGEPRPPPPEAPAEVAVAPAPPCDPLLVRRGCWTFKFGVFAGAQFVAEQEAFWGLSDAFAPTAAYEKDRTWGEFWAIPSVRATWTPGSCVEVYGGLAVAATGNLGRDLFEDGDDGRVSLENAFVGVKVVDPRTGWTIDASAGQQPYRLGTGMLIDLGAQNGDERGAVLVSPRRSWEWTGIVRASRGALSADVFALDYNEIDDEDPDTTLLGGKVELRLSETPGDEYAGLAYVNALDSTMPYIQAPLTILEDGRDGTQTVSAYLRLRPARCAVPGLYVGAELAYQWNDRIDLTAWAVSLEVGHQWTAAPLKPKLGYAFRRFSGDDPGTSGLERFDPLYYDGGVHAFASGSNAALAFYNTNVASHRLALSLAVSPRDTVNLGYWRVDAVEEDSPLQFGQGGRLQEIDGQLALVSGVPTRHLSDDLYVEWVRVLTPNA